jgi:hypothetical protein
VGAFAQQLPSHRGNQHPTGDTDDGNRDAENSDQRPEQGRSDEDQKLLVATSASRFLCCGVQSVVRLRKIGADPSGFTTGNRPAKTRRNAFEISFTARSSLNATAQSFGNKAANGGSLHAG